MENVEKEIKELSVKISANKEQLELTNERIWRLEEKVKTLEQAI